jgi:hypothetical protein
LSGSRDSCQNANLADEKAVCDRLEMFQAAVVSNIIKEVLCVVIVLLKHQMDDVESIDSLNNDPHEFLGPDLLLHLLRDVISRYAPFRRTVKFQSEPTPFSSHKFLNFLFPISLENEQQLSASFYPNRTQTGR